MSDELLQRWPEASRLLDELLALDTEARRARIAALAAADPALAPMLRALAAESGSGDEPMAALPADLRLDAGEAVGTDGAIAAGARVGPYRVLDEIGRGGMARVWRAVEAGAPSGPSIALKVLDGSLATPAARSRFEREQRTLARLDHPNIARSLSAGVTEAGHAWLAMELVDGISIDRYCDTERLSIDDRLRLFLQVCSAVEHAHRAGIVHRDLKPSNILVDRQRRVRLLDFGIARHLAAVDTADVSRTSSLLRPLTPAYATPEQLAGGRTGPPTDVYQLGLVLFELLVGHRASALPPDPGQRGGSLVQPSRVAADPAFGSPIELAERAALRAATPEQLAQRLTGALDDIVRRATRRRPDVRYPSAVELKQAIERAGAAPAAAPTPHATPNARGVTGHTVSRRWLIVGALLAGLAVILVLVLLQRRQAERTAQLRERARLASAALQAGDLAQALDALPEIVAAQTTSLGRAHADTLASRVQLGAALRASGQPTASAATLAAALDDSRALDESRWELRVRLLKEIVPAELTLSRGLSAEGHARALVDLVRTRVGPESPDHLEALQLLARAYTVLLKYGDAITAQEQIVGLHERLYGSGHAATGKALLSLGTAYSRFARDQDATRVTERAHAILREALGLDHADTVLALRNLGVSFKYAGDLRAAERCYREVLAIRRRTLGPLHRDALEAASLVQLNVAEQGRLAEARRLGRALIDQYEAVVRAADVDPVLLDDYALLLHQIEPADLRNPLRSVAMAERAVRDTRRADYARLRTLAHAQRAAGRDRDALDTAREALALPAALQSWTLEQLVVDLLTRLGAPGEKESWLLDRLAQFSRLGRPDDFLAGTTLRHLAETALADGRLEVAERRYRDALAQLRKTGPDSHWQVGRIKSDLGAVLVQRRALEEAEPLLLEGYRTLTADRAVRPALKVQARARLQELYAAIGQSAEAGRGRREVIARTR